MNKVGNIAKALLKLFAKVILAFILFTTLATTFIVLSSGDNDFQYAPQENIINDITGLNPVGVDREIAPTTTNEIIEAILNSTGPISIGGGRYSQGGQISYEDSLHIDMRQFNAVLAFDQNNHEITVQPGIIWRDLQEHIDPYDLSVRIMQTYANFTVGGSMSVNAHGRYIGEGPLVHSVKALKLVLADGSLITASPNENSDLFYGAIGGYGGIGVIVEATLLLAENTRIERRTHKMDVEEYYDYFVKNIRNNKDIVFHNADLYPPNYEHARDVSWYITDKALTTEDRMIPVGDDYYWGPKIAGLVADYDFGKTLREYLVDPILYLFDRVVWRNWEASYDVAELEPEDRIDKTYVLREYFIPVAEFDNFVPKMAEVFQTHDANIINVSIRHAHPDPGTLLAWAKEEMFAFVVYYQQGTDRAAMKEVEAWSTAMIDAVIAVNGSYYLPYQVFATPEQFTAAYPNSPAFFDLKNNVDPDYRFRNSLWRQHYKGEGITGAQQARIENYKRGEEQTFLTIPEWYLVFNPLEYATFLEAGNSPSDFPFFASIDEYWRLYDRAREISQGRYPENPQYLTMLKVIGISTTIEYMYKSFYEQTIGRFTRWTASGENTPEDLIIANAQRAYSDLIFDEAWYQFSFTAWIKAIWSEPEFFGQNFVRKIERKISFTLEFSFKALYAKLIGYASATAYEASDGQVYLTASLPQQVISNLPDGVTILLNDQGEQIISVPRWGEFTRILPRLAESGVNFQDISGNKQITISFIVPDNEPINTSRGTELFSSPLVSDKSQRRIFSLVKVEDLHTVLNTLLQSSIPIEHIYDY